MNPAVPNPVCQECGKPHEFGLICPECHEPAIYNPLYIWNVRFGSLPRYSHLDGEPLCPVVGNNGYEPAQPINYHGQDLP
jgi:hypothetical protein